MSFILDALKKSEAERLRKDTPGFSAVPGSAPPKPTSHWIWIVAALIVINLGVLLVILMKPERVQDPVAGNSTAAPTSRTPSATTSTPSAGAGLSAIVDAPEPARLPATMAADPVTRAASDIATRSADPAPPVARYGSANITESYATFNDLRAQGVLQLPDMHLDIHVYSSESEDRFVFVNMSKYKERATLDEGPVVREITPDGVILEHLGTKFLLPRE
jgi:general secretion pathway protein B